MDLIALVTPRCCIGRMKYVGLFIGCLAKLIAGSVFVFNTYGGAIKKTFNYTEKELELQSSMFSVGFGVGFIPGMFYDHFGPGWTSGFGTIISVISYVLLWCTTKAVHFYSRNSWLMSIYFFLAELFCLLLSWALSVTSDGCSLILPLFQRLGSLFTIIVTLSTNLVNFKEKDRGKVAGILNTFFSGSPLIFSQIYYHIFAKDDPNSYKAFSNMMLLFAFTFGLVGILCVLFLRIYEENSQEEIKTILHKTPTYNSLGAGHTDDGDDAINPDETQETNYSTDPREETNDPALNRFHPQQMSLKQIIKHLDFHLFVWMFTTTAAVGVLITNNITEFSESLHFEKYNATLVMLIPLMTTVLSAFIGIISDKINPFLSRDRFIVIGLILFIIAEILFISFTNVIGVLILSTVIVGVSLAIIWSLAPALISEMFHVNNVGRNWGIVLLLVSLINLILQLVYGALYDGAIKRAGDRYCYGMECFRTALGICIFLTIVSIVIGIILIIRIKKNFGDEHYPLTQE